MSRKEEREGGEGRGGEEKEGRKRREERGGEGNREKGRRDGWLGSDDFQTVPTTSASLQ